MGPVVLDASVVLAALDPEDALHDGAVRELRAVRSEATGRPVWVLPASVLAEVLVGAASRGHLDAVRRRVVDAFGPVRPLDEDVAVAAARRRSNHPGLRLPDAVVLATADVDGAQRVLTGDRRWSAWDDRVVVVSRDARPG